MDSRSAQASNEGLTTSLAVAVLSDDTNKIALVKHLLALSKHRPFSLQIIPANGFSATQLYSCDLILLDRDFGQRLFNHTVDELKQATAGNNLPPLIVLLDEDSLADDLSSLASSVKNGVDDFILSSELSLKKILQTIDSQSGRSTSNNNNNRIDQKHTGQQPLSTQPAAPVLPQLSDNTSTFNSLSESIAQATDQQQGDSHSLAVDESNREQSQTREQHQLTIDLENQRVHLSQHNSNILTDEADTILTIEEWLQLLDQQGAEEFSNMLQRASEFLSVPKSISCTIKSKAGISYPGDITEIQIKENGQGRVVGVSAQVLIGDTVVNASAHSHTEHSGFDNLADIANVAMVDKVWMNIAESLPLLCLVLDQNGYIVRVVNSDRSSTHNFPDAFVGQTLTDLLGIESLDNYVESIKKTLNTGKAHQQTIAYAGANGTRWFDTFITKLRGNLAMSREVLWTAFDITSGRQAYQDLLKNHDALTDTLNDAPVIFCQKDADGRYRRVNRTFCETFNVRAEIIAGRNDEDVFSGQTLEHMRQQDRELAEHGGTSRFMHLDAVNGNPITIQWHKFALKGHSGNGIDSIAAFGFIQDSTSTQTANTPPLTNDNLLLNEEGETAQTANMPEPSGAINQDFKAILKNIVNYTEIAISQKSAGRENRVIEYLSEVTSASQRARDLIIESSDPSGDDTFEENVELKPLVRDIVQMLKPTLPSAVNFQTDLEDAYGKANLSPVRFQRIVMQLLVSARDSSSNTNAEKNKSNGSTNNTDNEANTILLSLKNQRYDTQSCASCEQKLQGDYIVLSVKTASGSLDAADLKKMIDAAAKSQQQKNSGRKKNQNIVAMAHDNDGHVLIDYQRETITLKLLFKQTSDFNGNDDEPSKKNRPATAEVTSLSSL